MNKVFRTLLTAVASIAVALGFAVSPAIAVNFDNSPATGISISGTSTVGSVLTVNEPTYAWSDSSPTYNWYRCTSATSATYLSDLAPTTFNRGCTNLGFFAASKTYTVVSADLGKYLTATVLMDDAVGMNMPTNSGKSLAASVFITEASSTPTPTPSASATPTPTPAASAAPVVGTAAALAELPKASTQPKLKFDSSGNGLGKASKKSLKKVAEVTKDGYGVRVTGAAGMQPGVSKDVVKALAKKRAMEIRAYLIKQGVPTEDIIIKTKIFPIGKAPATLVKVETLN